MASDDNDFIVGGSGNDVIAGFGGDDNLFGEGGDDTLQADAGNDRLEGGDGNDVLNGNDPNRLGHDTLLGGAGNDIYFVDSLLDVAIEKANEGHDTINSNALSYTLPDNFEDLVLGNFDNVHVPLGGDGNALDNHITGNFAHNNLFGEAGNDRLSGGGGQDNLVGGTGNDIYDVDSSDDVVTEQAGEGRDVVVSTALSYTLGENVEDLILAGNALGGDGNELDNLVWGSEQHNNLFGEGGNDLIIGGGGKDTMEGGTGNDTYIVDSLDDTVIEVENEGRDTVSSSVPFTLGDNVEDLVLVGTALGGDGNKLDNVMTGNDVHNNLFGEEGADTLNGGGGNDFLDGGEGNDRLNGGDGDDQALLGFAGLVGGAGDDIIDGGAGNDIMDGGAGNDSLIGGTGNDKLDGGTGNDAMAGGAGDDIYFVDSLKDTVTENAGEGFDTIFSTVANFKLAKNVENIVILQGALSDQNSVVQGNAVANHITGNDVHNNLVGDAGDDVLNGGGGQDHMEGGTGNDTFVVDSADDEAIEQANQGHDTVQSSAADYQLGVNVEDLQLLNGALSGSGNALDNTITGNDQDNQLFGLAGNDRIDGGAGNDTMTGGTGNDTYLVDSIGDHVVEAAGEGRDTVISTALETTLANNVEDLLLQGKAETGTGNDLDNVITGNAGDNFLFGLAGNDTINGEAGDDALKGGEGNDKLNGGAGDDTLTGGPGLDILTGGSGNDTYVIGAGDEKDKIVETGNGGIDLVFSNFKDTTLGANLENLSLADDAVNGTGNNLDNVITGNAAANQLLGMAGNDTLTGGEGGDVLDGGVGIDTASYALSDGAVTVNLAAKTASGGDAAGDTLRNIENLTGSTQDDTLTGDAGANRLDGGAGEDTLAGGAGNDIYLVDSQDDHVVEAFAQGHDTVLSSVDLALGENLEDLVLQGKATNGVGNLLDNTITGNDRDNHLQGGGGNDLLNGGDGSDFLEGGDGNDALNGGAGGDTLTGNDGKDVLNGDAGNDELQGGAGNDILNGGDGDDAMIGDDGADTMNGGKGDDVYFVDADDKLVEAANAGFDRVEVGFATDKAYVLGANLEQLDLSGDATAGVGNAAANELNGLDDSVAYHLDGAGGDDFVEGADSKDVLLGGAGDDVLEGRGGADTLDGGAGSDWADYSNSDDGVTIDLGAGTASGGDAAGDTLKSIENLRGSFLNDTLTGDAGKNIIDGSGGDDVMAGGAGDDIYMVESADDVVLELANKGRDTVQSLADSYTLADNVEDLVLIEPNTVPLTTSGGGDGIGNALANVITGNSGDNHLNGMAGNDVLNGGDGDDVLTGGEGIDTLNGGKGDDTYVLGTGDAVDKLVETAKGGHDLVELHGATDKAYLLAANLEDIDLLDQASAATGNSGDNRMQGFNDLINYHLDGGAGNDTLIGAEGADVLLGGAGNDTLDGGRGIDRMEGGAGNDDYFVNQLADVIVEAKNGGTDTIHAGLTWDLNANGTNVENLILTGTGDFNGTGNALNNAITGNAGDNKLTGGAGDDVLEGGLGADTLDGGSGKDVFLYRIDQPGQLNDLGGDTIISFETGKDKIDLRDLFHDLGISESSNPFADGHLALVADGNGNTLLQFDKDGSDGPGQAITIVAVQHDPIAQTDILF